MMPAHITRLMTFAQHGEPKAYAASDMMRADLEALVMSKLGEPLGFISAERVRELRDGRPVVTTITTHQAFEDDVQLRAFPAGECA